MLSKSIVLFALSAIVCTALAKDIENSSEQQERLQQLATKLWQKGYKKKALPLMQQAQQMASGMDTVHQVKSLLSLGRLQFELGNYPASIKLLRQAMALDNSPITQATALNTIATTLSTLNSPDEASKSFGEAYTLAKSVSDPGLRTTILLNQLRHALDYKLSGEVKRLAGLAWEQRDLLTTSTSNISLATLYERAYEDIRLPEIWLARALELLKKASEIASADDDLLMQSYATGYQSYLYRDAGQLGDALTLARKASFLANSAQAFESIYLWEWQIARILQAQSKTDDAIKGYFRAIDSLEHVRQALIDGSPFTFHQKIQPLFTGLADILLASASKASGEEKQHYLNQVQDVLEQVKSAELQDYFQNECVIPEESIDLHQIPGGTAVIYPVILPDRLEVLVNIGTVIFQYTSPVAEKDLEALVNDFRDNLQTNMGDDEYLEIGEELYDLMFADAEEILGSNNIDTLLVIPDGVLRTVPVSAIYDGDKFMVQKYAIATTPGVKLTLPKSLDVGQAQFFAGGISESVQGFSALPGVSQELGNLANKYSASVLQDSQFSRNTVSQQLASADYSIVHIATHGHFDSNPEKSFLLAYDDKLTMDLLEQAISARRSTGDPLELLVLSACESAAGDSRAALGLAGVAIKAGARSAIATLWQISDAATVKIIGKFYEDSLLPGVTKAEALQTAQIRLIESEDFYHPTDWAPFLLIGNWL